MPRGSLPSRERGLKFRLVDVLGGYIMSLPSRERGLKSMAYDAATYMDESLPSRERGLKYSMGTMPGMSPRSLPSRERGLKYCSGLDRERQGEVAPFTGAWIEILIAPRMVSTIRSLPSRERGLKYKPEDVPPRVMERRSLHGSVD